LKIQSTGNHDGQIQQLVLDLDQAYLQAIVDYGQSFIRKFPYLLQGSRYRNLEIFGDVIH